MTLRNRVRAWCREVVSEITSERVAKHLGIDRSRAAHELQTLASECEIERTGAARISFVRSNGRRQSIDVAVYRWVG